MTTVYGAYMVTADHDLRGYDPLDTEISEELLLSLFETKEKAQAYIREREEEDAHRPSLDEELPFCDGMVMPKEEDPYMEKRIWYEVMEMTVY